MFGSAINNKETLTVSGDSIDYDGYIFTKFTQKIIETTLEHDTQYRFSDYVSSDFILKGVVSQSADVTPYAGGVNKTYLKPVYGVQVAMNVKIAF